MVKNDHLLLKTLLETAVVSDIHEEPAMDYIEDHKIPIYSHSRTHIIQSAFKAGWRPECIV